MHFNSRTPRGVRQTNGRYNNTAQDFNSRTPRGVRPFLMPIVRRIKNFNSRTPRGVRRIIGKKSDAAIRISTHAPHAECDGIGLPEFRHPEKFQLTHPTRSATFFTNCHSLVTVISTHAPHAECDPEPESRLCRSAYFNSRTPRGVRQNRRAW